MAQAKRCKTRYPGVFYRETERIGMKGTEKVFYIVFKKEGKVFEEKVGRQFADNMTEAKAAGIRAERIEGKRASRKEIREAQEAIRQAELQKPTIERLWEIYRSEHADKKSLRTDGYNFTNHLIVFAKKTPDEICTADLVRLRKELFAKGLQPATVRHVLALLRLLIRFGVKNGLCAMPDPRRLHFEMPRVDNQKTETLTHEQLIALKKALDEEPDQNAAAFMRLALATGMRRGALMGLRWDDLDFVRGFITLRGEIAKKGKTEVIPMTKAAREILEHITRSESPYVFPGRDGGPRHEFRRIAQRVKRKAGLPEDFRPLHGLRHAYASFLASSGQVDLYTLQRLLTHSSPQMTQRYAHLADETLQRAASISDKLFNITEE
jgi:integrase